MGAVNKVMISRASTVDLHVTSTMGGGGGGGASTTLFDQWLNVCESSLRIPEESRLGSLGPPPSLPCI